MPLPLVSTSLMLTRTIGIAFLLLLSLSSSSSSVGVFSFVITTRGTGTVTTSPLLLFVSSNDSNENEKNIENNKGGSGEEESEEDFQRRMAIVRSLQMSFYGSSAIKPTTEAETNDDDNTAADINKENDNIVDVDGLPEYNIENGSIERLSLFRAAWHELPGRSNVLIIRDPVYTNMFERMFYTHTYSNSDHKNKSPWMMFGHLYMPKDFFGDKTKYPLRSNNDTKYKLSTWNETNYNKRSTVSSDSAAAALSSTAVLGTLMYVRDYRRLKDGRILVLVHASERFVIDSIHQEIPYSIVDVKLLPDIEELHHEAGQVGVGLSSSKDNSNDDDEQLLLDRIINEDESLQVGPARNKAIQESIQKYHGYECNPNQKLNGIPTKSDLSIADITHDAISSVLPYCPFIDDDFNFDDDNNDNNDDKQRTTTSNTAVTTTAKVTEEGETTPSPSLELQLLLKGIMKIPPSDKRFNYGSNEWTTDELEHELWKIVDEFLIVTNKTNTISPLLLELRNSSNQKNQNQNKNKEEKEFSNYYPNHRRQRRFSYSVAYLLESVLPIGITTTSTSTGSTASSSTNNNSNLNEGRYSDNFRNGGRRYSSSKDNKSYDKATTKTSSSSTSSTTKDNNNNGNGNIIDHDSYSDYLMDINEIQQFRSILLSIPSTRQRLRFVLETFYQWRFYL
ncbi:hypothetical protein FRACYDRAFT_249544 [Fragilariopsis cylindrus CCMP1102]|uniref:Uncharacterized protein n=1 Tax=Fragilariopsis cylindrus CCMP1102 TaxID=635003 RepID=A0A1E7ERM3_9STRA|nr:hypothetical protein FRACYDRAFT_249544 [Fragilariopsis cylindrus CCMP1102]|eukprot:OEU08648.1 hypothetical protein FRACYDRAFT_249544 [Fragilariopsis cylindrus CCMP1102]